MQGGGVLSAAEADAFNAGVRVCLDMARVAAITIETGEGADEIPKRGAVVALYSFADAAKALLIGREGQSPATCSQPVVSGEGQP